MAMATSPGFAQGFDLTCEDLLKAEIISRSRQRRRISVQGKRRDRGAISLVADRQFGREMLGIGGTSPVPEKHQLAATFDRLLCRPLQGPQSRQPTLLQYVEQRRDVPRIPF